MVTTSKNLFHQKKTSKNLSSNCAESNTKTMMKPIRNSDSDTPLYWLTISNTQQNKF